MKQWLQARAWRWELREGDTIIGVVHAEDSGRYYALYGPAPKYLGEYWSLKAAKRAVEKANGGAV